MTGWINVFIAAKPRAFWLVPCLALKTPHLRPTGQADRQARRHQRASRARGPDINPIQTSFSKPRKYQSIYISSS
jgi:hypothetical protein